MAPDPVPPPSAPSPVEKSAIDLLRVQAGRIDAQVKAIASLWDQVKALKDDALSEKSRAKDAEREKKQLQLEAWLGLAKVAIVVLAVVALLWAHFDKLPDVLKAMRGDISSDRATKTTDAQPADASRSQSVQINVR